MKEKGLRVVVLGASTNPSRYSYIAVLKLAQHGHIPIPVGLKAGAIGDFEILPGHPMIEDVDTVTLYVGPKHEDTYIDYILSLAPRRVIFNPGAENQGFADTARKAGIVVENACTLVMLSTGQFHLEPEQI